MASRGEGQWCNYKACIIPGYFLKPVFLSRTMPCNSTYLPTLKLLPSFKVYNNNLSDLLVHRAHYVNDFYINAQFLSGAISSVDWDRDLSSIRRLSFRIPVPFPSFIRQRCPPKRFRKQFFFAVPTIRHAEYLSRPLRTSFVPTFLTMLAGASPGLPSLKLSAQAFTALNNTLSSFVHLETLELASMSHWGQPATHVKATCVTRMWSHMQTGS
jgi:hypothetical protein